MSRYLPERSLRAAFAGVEAAVLTWLTTALLAMVAYAATAAAPGMAETNWATAVGAGSQFWALGLGGTMLVEETAVSLAPLGVPLLAILLLNGSIRRGHLRTIPQVAFAAGTFVVAVALLGYASGVAPGRHLLGALLIGAVAGTTGIWGRTRELPDAARTWLDALPRDVGEGFRSGRILLLWLAVAGSLMVGAAVFLGWDLVAEISESLRASAVSGVAFGLVQAAYLPNLAAWALAWVAGPGFMVGTGTSFAPAEVLTEPLPAIPVLGALPAPGFEPGYIVVLLPIVIGAVWALWRSRRAEDPKTWQGVGYRVLAAFATVFLGALVWFALAGGALGPGRMAEVGVISPALAALALSAQVSLGYAIALVTFHLLATYSARREAARSAPRSSADGATPAPSAGSPSPAYSDQGLPMFGGRPDPGAAEAGAEGDPEWEESADGEWDQDPEGEWEEYPDGEREGRAYAAVAPTAATAPIAATAHTALSAASAHTAQTALSAATAHTALSAATAQTALSAATAHTALTALTAPTAITAEVPEGWDEEDATDDGAGAGMDHEPDRGPATR